MRPRRHRDEHQPQATFPGATDDGATQNGASENGLRPCPQSLVLEFLIFLNVLPLQRGCRRRLHLVEHRDSSGVARVCGRAASQRTRLDA